MPKVEVVISYSPLAFIYALFRPNLQIDGGAIEKATWGVQTIELPAGPHEIAISYPWLFLREAGRNSAAIDLADGATLRVSYRAGLIRYLPGKITVEDVLAGGRAAS
jgi:hypothetical protein